MLYHLLNIMLVATIATSAASLLIVISQRWHGKHTLDHDLEGVQKFHTIAVPRIGGAAIVSGMIITGLWSYFYAPGHGTGVFSTTTVLLIAASVPVFLAGLIEDLTKKVSVRVRLAAAIISAILASWLFNATVNELNIWGIDILLAWAPFGLVVTALVVAGGVNAVNIIDGFNGLASSTVIVMLAALAAVAFYVGDLVIVQLALLGVGSALGFLFVNYPTGRLFLGDGGAYFLGFWVAEIAVMLTRHPDVNAWQVLAICAYPVIEVIFSIYRRRIVRKSSPGAPDGLHLHTLVYRRVVARFISSDPRRPWLRNAAVSLVIIPWIVGAAVLSVFIGDTVAGSMFVVAAQVFGYISVYSRLVHGRWIARRDVLTSGNEKINANA